MMRVAKITALVLITLIGLTALWVLRGPAMVFLLSLIVAAAARGPVDYLMGRGLPRSLAVAATYLVSLLVILGCTLAAIYLVSGELGRLTQDFKRLYEYTAGHTSLLPRIERTIHERLPPAEQTLKALVGHHGEQAVRIVLGTAIGLFGAVVDAIFVLVLSIYWTIDRELFERLWLSLMPLPYRISARKLWRVLEAELGAYARSEISQSILAGIVLGAGYYLLGLNYPALLALIAALSWLVPWLGTMIALSALAVAELPALVLGGPGPLIRVLAAAVFTVIVFVLLETSLEPRLFNRRRYNSLFIVLAVMALAEQFGIFGLLLGPMVAVAVQAIVEHLERQVVQERAPSADLASLQARLVKVRAAAIDGDALPVEWTSIADRLETLIGQVRENVPEAGQSGSSFFTESV